MTNDYTIEQEIVDARYGSTKPKANKAHAIIAPSNMERVWNCPGSVTLCESEPPKKATQYMAQGTAAHEVAEYLLTGKAPTVPMLNERSELVAVLVDGWEFEIVDEEGTRTKDTVALGHVMVYVDYVKQMVADYPHAKVFTESKVLLFGTDLDGSERRGTVDRATWIPTVKLSVADLKYGAGTPVEVEENKQMLEYALGIWLGMEEWQRVLTPIIEITVVQPRGMGGGIRSWTCDTKYLEQFKCDLAVRIQLAKDAKANAAGLPHEGGTYEDWVRVYLAAGSWCEKTFCPAQANCPALTAHCAKLPSVDFANLLTLPATAPKDVDVLVEPRVAGDDLLIAVRQNKELFESWMNACVDELDRRALNGKDYTDKGLKLVYTRTNRKLVPDAGAILSEYKDNIYKEPKLKSLGELDKIIPKELMEKATVKPEGRKVLAPLSDKRVSVELPKAGEDFKNLCQ